MRSQGMSTKGAPGGVGGLMRTHGDGLCACETYSRPIVEEVCGATEGEGVVTGLPPKVSKNLIAWRWELSVSIMIVGVVVVVETVTVAVEVGLTNYVELIDATFSGARGVD